MSDMQDIRLVSPNESYKEAVLQYKQEFLDEGKYISGSASLGSAESFEAWLENVRYERGLTGPTGDKVPATLYLAIRQSDGQLVGMVSIRHELNDYLMQYGGHIGYSVRKSERRKGYGTRMLELALEYAHTLGIKDVLVTCDVDNIGSAMVIQSNGGKLENEVKHSDGTTKQRYWISTSTF